MVNIPSLILKNRNKALIQSFEKGIVENLGEINVAGGGISPPVYVNVKNSWKNYLKNEFKTLIYRINHRISLEQLKKFVSSFFVENKSRYILYIYYILLYNNNNNNNKIYSDGKKVFFSQFQQEKKSFSLKNQRRSCDNLVSSILGGV